MVPKDCIQNHVREYIFVLLRFITNWFNTIVIHTQVITNFTSTVVKTQSLLILSATLCNINAEDKTDS